MRNAKHWLMTIVALLCSVMAKAGMSPAYGYDFIDGNIYYKIISETDSTVKVSYHIYYGYDNHYHGGYDGEIIIPETVKYNDKTFRVTTIGENAFSNCSNLTSVIIPESVTSIESCAFLNCKNCNIIVVPKTMASVEEDAFDGCESNLRIINLSDLEILEYTTNDNTTIYHGYKVVSIDEIIDGFCFETKEDANYLHYYLGSDTELILPQDYNGGDYQISDGAFRNCESLVAVAIPENSRLTSIGAFAFYNCSNLASITLPEGLTSVGRYAFDGCRNLSSVTILDKNTYIGLDAFRGTEWYNNQLDGVVYVGNALYKYKGTMSEKTSIETKEGTTSITDYAFDGCSSLASITIPEGVTSIGSYAFRGCSSLTAITIPEGVTSIGSCTFYNCTSLTAINIPEGVTSIEDYAFYYCSNLTDITIPEGVTSIGEGAFYYCRSLKTVINYSDLSLERGSCDNGYVACYADRVINIDEVIDGYAFKTKEGVHYLTGYIGDDTALTLPTDYKGENYQIGERAFYGCSSLTNITLPEGVTSIGNYAFYGCSSLKTVINYSDLSLVKGSSGYGYVASYADRVINIDEVIDGYAFKTKEGVHYLTGYIGDDTALTLPTDYKGENYQIGERAFYGCSSLTDITLPEGVTNIGSSAFSGCSSLKELTLGKGLRKITSGAFNRCEEIERITIHTTQPPTTTGNIFTDKVYENAMLYVPEGSIIKYQVMTGWSGFYNISEIEGGTPDYLTICQADNGAVKIAVDLGRTYRVQIEPTEGWTIHSVTINGTDMTDQLDENYTFTTPTLTGSTVLNVAYEQTASKVETTHNRDIKVRGHEGIIFIEGTEQSDHIAIYTTNGTVVAETQAESSNTEIAVESGQLYMVQVANKVVKILM